MTLSVQSAVYQQSGAHASFDGSQLEQDRLNPHHQEYRNSATVQSYSAPTQHIPSVNINAAIASSLKLKNSSSPSQQMDSSLGLLNKIISFHKSPATPLDTLIMAHIEHMPNSTVLLNTRGEKSVCKFAYFLSVTRTLSFIIMAIYCENIPFELFYHDFA